MLSDALEAYYCSECGCGTDGELCGRCRGGTIDWGKTDRRWNGKTFWQTPTQEPEYKVPEPDRDKK